MSSLKHAVTGLGKNKLIEGTVLEVLGNRCSIQLVNNGKKLLGIPFIGGPISVGKIVYVNYASGRPVAECRGEESTFTSTKVKFPKTVRTEFTPAQVGGPSGEGVVALHATTHAEGGTDEVKLDDLATPDDNTALNASASAHGLLPKLSGSSSDALLGDGTWGAVSGGGDAADITYTPVDTNAWNGNADPGNVDDALDQLADRVYDMEGVSTVDAADVTYTPAMNTDWDGNADPGDVDNALDQLAERVDDLEGAGGGSGHTIEDETTPLTNRSKLSFQGAGVTATDDSGNDRTIVTIGSQTSVSPDLVAIFAIDLPTLALATGALRIYNTTGTTRTISKVYAAANTAPTGNDLIMDIHKDGTTIFGTQSQRPKVVAGANTGYTTGMTVTDWADGSYLTMDVDQIGSTVAGGQLTLHVVYSQGGYGQGTGGHTVEDETTAKSQRTKLSFQGTGVTVTDDSGNDRTIVTIPGASAASTPFPDVPPASPKGEDDEFENSSLNGKWTVVTNTAANSDIHTTWPSHIYLNFTGNQGYVIKQSYAPSGAFSLTAKFRMAPQSNYQGCHIFVYDNDESDGLRFTYEGATIYSTLSTKDGGSWTYNRSTLAMPRVNEFYVHAQRGSSNDWSCWFSLDGYTFWRVGTYSKTITIDHFTLEVNQSGATIPMRAGIDWVRRDWITL
jgi:hypothetical protein